MNLMKTLFKVLALGLFMTAAGIISGSAQTEECADLAACFEKYKAERKKTCGQRAEAVRLGKLIIEKFGADELNKEVINYVKGDVPKLETGDARCKMETRYNEGFKNKQWADFFAVSKELMNAEANSPLGLDLLLTHVSVGYDRAAVDKDDNYNNETLNYAKTALQKLESGQASKTGNYGVYVPFKSKENAQSWMYYIVGWLNYNKLNNKKEGVAYLYKSTTIGTENKNDISIYTSIGTFYFDEAARLDAEYRKVRQANNNEENDESKRLLGLARANADRGIDAFGRARKIATDSKAKPQVVEAINKTLTDLYKFRFNIAPEAKTPELESYVSKLISQSMPDPATEVTPVVEEVKPTTTGATTTAPVTNTATTATTSTMNRERTVTTNTTDATDAKTKTSNTTTKAKTPAKKPVIKKKGTR